MNTEIKTTRLALEQTVILAARRITRTAAEFPDDPSIWSENMDELHDAVSALDAHLDRAFAEKMA